MTILESESTGEGTPQGVVLALVSSDAEASSKDQESSRTLRMYNLSSLVSLAKWATTQKVGLHPHVSPPTKVLMLPPHSQECQATRSTRRYPRKEH